MTAMQKMIVMFIIVRQRALSTGEIAQGLNIPQMSLLSDLKEMEKGEWIVEINDGGAMRWMFQHKALAECGFKDFE